MERRFSPYKDWAPVFLRLTVGIILFAHGSQKMFGGMTKFTATVAQLDLPFGWLPGLFAYLAAASEFFGGILLILGLATRWAALLAGFVMLVAVTMVHAGQLTGKNGFEFPLLMLAACVSLVITGGGKASIDQTILNRDLL